MLFLTLWATQATHARTVEIEVHGMTCAFCVDSLERAFAKLESVSKVQISLKMKKIILDTDENAPTIETIKLTILNAGFTPTKITVLSNEK